MNGAIMLDEDTLRRHAHDACADHLRSLTSDEVWIELLDSDTEWDPFEQRHVFDQQIVIWRRYGTFEVILDRSDHPVGFVDDSQWNDCDWQLLERDEIQDIIQQAPIQLGAPVVERVEQGLNGSMDVLVRGQLTGTTVERWRVRINPSRRTVISFEPAMDTHDRA